MMVILGCNAFHADSAACLVVDGQVVGAVAEERLGERASTARLFRPTPSAGFSSDASGDFASLMAARCEGTRIQVLDRGIGTVGVPGSYWVPIAG